MTIIIEVPQKTKHESQWNSASTLRNTLKWMLHRHKGVLWSHSEGRDYVIYTKTELESSS